MNAHGPFVFLHKEEEDEEAKAESLVQSETSWITSFQFKDTLNGLLSSNKSGTLFYPLCLAKPFSFYLNFPFVLFTSVESSAIRKIVYFCTRRLQQISLVLPSRRIVHNREIPASQFSSFSFDLSTKDYQVPTERFSPYFSLRLSLSSIHEDHRGAMEGQMQRRMEWIRTTDSRVCSYKTKKMQEEEDRNKDREREGEKKWEG